jgi:hypothetical protein
MASGKTKMNEPLDQIPSALGTANPVAEINRLHLENLKATVDFLERAILIGELLTLERPKHEPGTWITWFRSNIHFSLDTYDDYRRVYENRQAVRLANVESIRDALKLITEATRKKKEPKAKQSTTLVTTAPSIATTVEPDDKAPLRTEAVAALKSLNVPHASDWVAEATGDTTEEIIKDALRLREGVRDPSKSRLILDEPVTLVTEIKPEPAPKLPEPPDVLHDDDQHAPLWELDKLLGQAHEIMKREGITKFGRTQDDDTETLISLPPAKKSPGRPKKAVQGNL